ncbi:formylglycine-generating enzyme family protein [Nioella nitratireducens]|uniref:formylglycine-generating enzyme family protein n=1 Tax=Nioella nitratireducens TaxID=1287720 RepID=UPI0008FCF9EF|nr:formylglycine-generating enzyme family protein [Nioella nitratireducens]
MTDTLNSCCSPKRNGQTLPAPAAIDRPGVTDPGRDESVVIPGGVALVGTDRPDIPVDAEGPLRKRKIKPFRIDATAVTNARFARFVAATGYVTEAERFGNSFVFHSFLPPDAPPTHGVVGSEWWRMVEAAHWRQPHGPLVPEAYHDDHPAVQISWADATAFAAWAGGRLPTEVEWEHAARGGLGDVRFPWGDQEPDDSDFLPCNIWQGPFPRHNTGADGFVATAPARSFAPNGYGLYNMVGNVWEWTSEPFRVRSLKKAAQRAHQGKAGYKLQKGGSFLCHISYCYRYRIAARHGNAPDTGTPHQGMRLVYDM